MISFDLTESFVTLISIQDEQDPKLGLLKDLKKVNVALTSFAESQSLTPDTLSVLHLCVDQEHLHPDLLAHINSLDRTEAYKGQNVSRFKKLVRHLPWPVQQSDANQDLPTFIEEQLPPHLRQVWFLLPRMLPSGSNARRISAKNPLNVAERQSLPLTLRGISLALTLLRVSKAQDVSDIRTLLEDCSVHIYRDIRLKYPPSSRSTLISAFDNLRTDVREFLQYQVEEPQAVTIPLEDLPEPLRTQVLTFKDRAEHGFRSDHEIKRLARAKYGLDLGLLSQVSITDYMDSICLGVGYVPREMYGDSLDIRDLLGLSTREQEIDGMTVTELYNPLVDFYREHEMARDSIYKQRDYDSRSFRMFHTGICAVAAYNGFFKLRDLFQKVYKERLDKETLMRRKNHKKEVFDRPWLSRQISNLKPRFHCIANSGSFRSKSDGTMSREARKELNLCLFYVTLLTLRYLGVRQQCVRDCVVGENVDVDSHQCVTFKWSEEKTKNGKGLIHRLTKKEHCEVLADLIDGVMTYHQKIYAYISGSTLSNESQTLKERRQKAIEKQFYVKVRLDGLCIPFTDESDFNGWFKRQGLMYLDFEGRLDEIDIPPSPHFYRGMFADWLRYDLKCSPREAADIAGDSEKTFESEYVHHPTTFDATDLWTRLCQEVRQGRDSKSAIKQDEELDYRKLVEWQASMINQLQEQIKELKVQQPSARAQSTSS